MSVALLIAEAIRDGFDRHYQLFRARSAGAKARFESSDWDAVREASKARIPMYDQRVREAVATLEARFPAEVRDESLWPRIKLAYIGLLYDHRQPECAETFFNSVACRVLDRRYYRNEYIFWRPAISAEYLEGSEATYRCYYPTQEGLRATMRAIALGFELACPFQDLERDLDRLETAVRERFAAGEWRLEYNFQVQVLASLFFRERSAYVVGRVLNGHDDVPFLVPLRKDDDGSIYVDALLLDPRVILGVLSLSRAYFMVDMEVPAAYVSFLHAMLPRRPRAELYTMIGLQKQGKTLFYRDLLAHIKHSNDRFVIAPGTKGMVMCVFTLPSFPYVFKVIRDWFDPPKDVSRAGVEGRYLMVKAHDRVGRLADTLEFSQVALPLDRFDPELVSELARVAASGMRVEGDRLVLRHLYVEGRLTPFDLYLRDADEAGLRHGLQEYGDAIKELAMADIFPGDMLVKNFGVTRHGRVVFYDYDEITRLTECRFRRIPTPRHDDDETSGEPWFSVGANDVFPEELPTFIFPQGRARELFLELHPELADPGFWTATQARVRAGVYEEGAPYPKELRFRARYGT